MERLRRNTWMVVVVALALVALPSAAAAQTGGAEAQVDGLQVRSSALFERTLRIAGTADAGAPVRIERLDPVAGWREVARAVTGSGGTFVARWRTDALGVVDLRAVVERDGASAAANDPLTARVTIFRPAIASWYGPGMWGRRTACGTKLTKRTLGVAHKSLPCGTQVQLYYKGRTVTTTVIDRGPFHKGREWDLTQATAKSLGVKGTGTVGVLPAAP